MVLVYFLDIGSAGTWLRLCLYIMRQLSIDSFSGSNDDQILALADDDPTISLGKDDPTLSLGKDDPSLSLGKDDPNLSLGKDNATFSLQKYQTIS